MRYLYSGLFYLALPYIFMRLWWRSRRQPAYRERLFERLGFYPFKLDQCLWVHAVSVGEVIAAIPLLKALKTHYPQIPLLVTTMTPTGATRVKAALEDSVKHVYLPYDTPYAVKRFLKAMRPLIGIIIETELWPNLLAACHDAQIPMCLVNARLSAKSAAGYRRVAALSREMLQKIAVIATHGEADAERFIALGAPSHRVIVTGSIKFDLELPADLALKSQQLREFLGKNRFIWIAASTHEGEEEMILTAHQELCVHHPEALLILVPRHPERFETVYKLCQSAFPTTRRSQPVAYSPHTAVYLGDTMGELLLMYGAADVAFVGGSLIPRGGHNMLEPCALGKPVLTGSSLFNFNEISELLIAKNALRITPDVSHLVTQLLQLIAEPAQRAEMGQAAKQVMAANRGALGKQLALIQPFLLNK